MKFLLPSLLILCSISFAQVPQTLLDSMPAVSAWKPGDDVKPLAELEKFTFALKPDAAERGPLEQALCQAFDNATTRESKTFIGKMLRVVGTERCIPHAEKWLTDPDGSHGARLVLGHLDSPKAGAAIHRALGKSGGLAQIGIINSLGDIAYAPALNDLTELAKDEKVGPAAVRAIGLIGGGDALSVLTQMKPGADNPDNRELLRAHEHAILRACETANANQSRPVYQRLFDSADERMKLAGLRGLVRVSPADAPELLTTAMKGDNPLLSATAVTLLSESGDEDTTKRFAAMLKDLPSDTQVPVLRALSERGDSAAADAVMERLQNGDEQVRAAAVSAIATLGTGKHVPALLDLATNGPNEREARSSLTRLTGEGVDTALADAAKSGPSERRVAAIRAAAMRSADIAPDLLGMLAGESDDKVRKEAIGALSKTANANHLSAILKQAAAPANRKYTAGFELALTALQRNAGDDEAAKANIAKQIVRSASKAADPEQRAVMIRLLDNAGTDQALAMVSAETGADHASVRDAAVRTLADWPTPTAIPALLKLTENTEDEVHKALGLRGVIRLAEQASKPETVYIDAMRMAKSPAEQKTVLGGLAAADSSDALKLVASYIAKPEVRNEAAYAAIEIGARVAGNDQDLVRSVVADIQSQVEDKNIRQRAQNIVNEMDKYDGYLLAGVWQVSPLYQVKGKDSKGLWAEPLAPENDPAAVKWSPLKKGFNNYACDLGSTFGSKDNASVYVRTSVWSETDRDAQLEIGSDDACRAWVNGKEVHAVYTHRGTSPGSDKVKVKLNKGWNPLMLKVVNHSGGWGFAMRVRHPDGSRIDGLKFDRDK